jgi:DNA-binding MarR family transcriptional regulator
VNETTQTTTAALPLWKLIFHAAERVEVKLEAELAQVGLSVSKMGVLKTLVHEGEPIPLSRLAGRLACVKSNVTQLVDRLEAEGLVARVNDPTDRRSILASITDAGRERFEAGSIAVKRAEQELFGDLSPEDYERFVAFLHRFTTGGCGQ